MSEDEKNSILELIRKHLAPHVIEFINLEASDLLYSIPVYDGDVYVIGHSQDGGYEWVYLDRVDNKHSCFSNAGYGSVGIAMRDGLIVACDDHHNDKEISFLKAGLALCDT